MNNEDKQVFVIECLTDPENRDKQAALAQWLNESEENRTLYADTKRIWEMMGNIPATPFSTTDGWETLSEQLLPVKVRRLLPWKSIAAAILVLIIAGTSWWQYDARKHKWTAFVADGNSLHLPDGSVIQAKPGTQLKYSDRVVKLQSGEAFFQIAKNEEVSFVVELTNAKVTVLGTAFNIRQSDNSTEVVVTEGKVSMTTANSQTILTRGDIAQLKDTVFRKLSEKQDYLKGWINGEFSFKNEKAGVIAAILSDYYGVEIPVKAAYKDRRITVKFSNASVAEVNAVLTEVLDK
jgi:transmembrane sensor